MADGGELAAWLRLTLATGIGGVTQRSLLSAFGTPEAVFAQSYASLAGVVGEKPARLLVEADNQSAIDTAVEWAEQPGHSIVSLADLAYPQALLEIPDPPSLLYVQGDVGLLAKRALAIVGSRNASSGGVQTAERFAAALTRAGWLIVSGLALGIDAAAHSGALATGGATVAVIGTGADRVYPARNRELAHEIVAQGAIVSEFPLGTAAIAANFPRRNRLIAGLCRGVLVVEAAVQSGSLITARLAAEQGREVFAVPGSIHSPLSRGCHALIRQGAKLVETAQDILEELGDTAGSPETPTGIADAGVGDDAGSAVLTALGHDPCSVDALGQRCGLTANALLAILFELELGGRIARLPGGLYQRLD